MAVDFIVAIAAKIGEYLVAPIGRQLGYLVHYNRNIENLRNQVQNLGDMRHDVQGSVDAANRNAEIIKKNVENWLTRVDGIKSEVETFLGDDVKFNKRCFSGRCPDWSSRYRLSKEAKKKFLVLTELQEESTKFDGVSFPAPPPGIESIPLGDFMAFESTKLAMEEIMEALKDVKINMIGLYGMGGVGKTSLVTKVGKQAKGDNLFDKVVMAVVSQTQNLRDIQGQIADKLGLKFDVETEPGRADRLRLRLKEEKRILVILDDIWDKLNLEAVGIPFGDDHKGCKIILTTRRKEVCHKMGIQTKVIHLNVLSEYDSWNLFRKYAGQGVDSTPLNIVAMEVVKYCGGLPIALVTVGRALGNEDLKEWEKAASKLKEFKPTDNEDVDQEVFSCLKLSYDYVKGEETKLCFLLCCLFPEDDDISIEELARYGMGQGLFKNVETMEEARCRAHTAIKNLKASCLLLDSFGEGFVKMHDVVRHAAISIASKDKNMWVRSGVGLSELPHKQTFKDETVISLMYNHIQELPDVLECPKLETLLLQENKLQFVPKDFFKNMEALKVLHISLQLELKCDLPPSVGSLKNLRTLLLDSLFFRDLSILGELRNLEILDFYGCEIEELTKEIRQLSKLRLLNLTECKIKIIRPNVISSLSKLEELYMRGISFQDWEVERKSERSNASLAELKSLRCLTMLSMQILNAGCLPKDLQLPKLIRFSILIGDINENDADMDNYPTSKTMVLIDIQIPSVDDIKCLLEKTEMLFLKKVKGLKNTFPDIGQEGLNCLKTLHVTHCSETEYLTNVIEGSPHIAFCRLEKLVLKNLDSLKELCHGLVLPAQSFQNLRVMGVVRCDRLLNVVPANLMQRLHNLKKLEIRNCHALENVFNLEGQGLVQERHMPYRLKGLYLVGLSRLMLIWKGSNRNMRLNNLRVVIVDRCKRLRNIFSPALATSLWQLKVLGINDCDIMEEVVSKEKEGEEAVDKIVFPQLKTLKLSSLHKFKNFCSGNKCLCMIAPKWRLSLLLLSESKAHQN